MKERQERKRSRTRDFEITFFEALLGRNPRYIEAMIPLAEAYTRNGFYKEGLAIDRRLSRLCRQDPIVYYNLACSLALMGHKTESIETLKKAISLGYYDFIHMKKDRDLRCLHDLPAFKQLIKDRAEFD